MLIEMSFLEITNKLDVLRKKQRQINIEIATLEEMKNRKMSEEFDSWNLNKSRKKDIYDPYPTVSF